MSTLVLCCTSKCYYFASQCVVNPVHMFRNINDQNAFPHATTASSERCSEDEHVNSESGVTDVEGASSLAE